VRPTDEAAAPRLLEGLRARLLLLAWGASLAFAALTLRLYGLQILRGEEMRSKGRRNYVSQIDVPHDRGIIFDRHGRPLVDNRPSLDLQVTPAFVGPKAAADRALDTLARLLEWTPDVRERWGRAVAGQRGLDRFRPLAVARDLHPAAIEAIESARSLFLLDGVDIVERRRRYFLHNALAAHVLGYVGEIDGLALEAEKERGNPEQYQAGDLIGRDGLERTLEGYLRGHDGSEKIVVDAKGRRQRQGGLEALLGDQRRVEPTPGHNVYLSLDLDLQRIAEAAFLRHGRAGSVVALDAKTFEVLAIASLPGYDANLFSGSFRWQDKTQLDADVLKPWLNRSIAGQYAPGSTFKVVTALAALSADPSVAKEHVRCPGHFTLGSHTWRCWRDAGHGPTPLLTAIKQSCDVFFYSLGARLGIEPLAEAARTLGFGQKTGIALRGEQPGLVPDEAFHRRGGYVRGMAVNASIGQGSVMVTPLQLAVAYAALATGRRPATPQLVHRIESADWRSQRWLLDERGERAVLQTVGEAPEVVFRAPAPAELPLPYEAGHLALVREGLTQVAQARGGTAYAFRSQTVPMAGKTGTTQVVKLGKERLRRAQTSYFERDDAGFVAYAPLDEPAIVVAVLNEHGGHGGSAAAPVAVEIIEAYARRAAGEAGGETR
jgi:penicillin-binding protein 2